MSLLELREVSKVFPRRGGGGVLRAVDRVSLDVDVGETVGLVGESGSGKSTLARVSLGLLRPDEGSVYLQGVDLASLAGQDWRRTRRTIQPVFQDPAAAFNPRKTVLHTLSQALRIAGKDPASLRAAAVELLEEVGLAPGEALLSRFAHQLSGGQRQRLAIGRAMALKPKLIVADEPVSSLDVSMRGYVMNLLVDLQYQKGVAYLFITHDLSVVRSFAHRVVVMYRGGVVEQGPTARVFARPLHPYTELLLAATPSLDRDRQPALAAPSVRREDPPSGCPFYSRCPIAIDRCSTESPKLQELGAQHLAACHLSG